MPTQTSLIAILAPMRSELRPLLSRLGLRRTGERGEEFFRGAVGDCEIVAALTGMGMRAGAAAAAKILEVASPDHLVVVGIAGGIGGSVAVGDLVVPERVLNLETGESFEPTPLGDQRARGVLASSDALLESPRDAAELAARGVVAIDMETAAIAAVCRKRGCPWSVFRTISDRADDGTTDAAVLGLANPDGSPNPAAVIRFVLTRPWRVPQLVRLAKGSNAATRAAADAVVAALTSRAG
jgi:adenosylhomocysteine nucleosidase